MTCPKTDPLSLSLSLSLSLQQAQLCGVLAADDTCVWELCPSSVSPHFFALRNAFTLSFLSTDSPSTSKEKKPEKSSDDDGMFWASVMSTACEFTFYGDRDRVSALERSIFEKSEESPLDNLPGLPFLFRPLSALQFTGTQSFSFLSCYIFSSFLPSQTYRVRGSVEF